MKLLIQTTRRDGVMSKGEWKRGKRAAILPCSVVFIDNVHVLVCCPACGHIVTLEKYTIDPDGTVTPSLDCPFPDCDFHEFVKLADWKA